jgi:hypothetical protein
LKIKIFVMRRELKCLYGVGFILALLYAIGFILQAINSVDSPLFNVDLALIFLCLAVAVRLAQLLFGSGSGRELI